jgi:hypothetical protein
MTSEELNVAVEAEFYGFVGAIVQKSTEILKASTGGVPFSAEEGAQTLEDVALLLAVSTIKANKQKWLEDVPTPTSRAWPF